MSDENPDAPQETKGPQWRQMEANLTAEKARGDALEAQLGIYRGNAIQQAARLAGFQPDADGKFGGPAGLLVGEFERTIGDQVPTVEAFSALATQYGVAPTTAPLGAVGEQGATGTPSLAEQLIGMQAGGNGITQTGTAPLGSPTRDDQMKAALDSGNIGHLLDLQAGRA